MTRSIADHQQTQPLTPCPVPPAIGAIPAQRGAKPASAAPDDGHGTAATTQVAKGVEGVATNRRLRMIATVLTACTLLLGIWATVVTSGATDTPGGELSSIGSGERGPATGTPAAAQPNAPVLAPGEIGGEGIYRVGSDIQPGTYRTAGPSPAAFDDCYWERSKDTSGELKAVIAKGLVSGPATVTIKPADRAFKSSGCETWIKVR